VKYISTTSSLKSFIVCFAPFRTVFVEKDITFSPALTAAFAFADSLTHGACGHDPIKLDILSWNKLIKACCYRGAFFRAFELLNETIPRNGLEPDSVSYNTILAALARVGDYKAMNDIYLKMTNKGVKINGYTVQALVDGLLNIGDISGAITLMQDMFNQENVLPPYTSHLKVIEFALGNELVYEAKRQGNCSYRGLVSYMTKHHKREF